MRGQFEDLTERRFDRLLVLNKVYHTRANGKKEVRWHCLCDCGNYIDVPSASLTHNLTRSCGCIHAEQLRKRNKDSAKRNQYDLSGDYGIGWTTNTNKEFYFDLEDYEKIKNYCWFENTQHYIETCANNQTIKMHSLIMNTLDNTTYVPDHIHGKDTRNDNRKSNLRIATCQENNFNKSYAWSKYSDVIGVNWHDRDGMWEARIGVNYKTIYLGRFENFDDAVKKRLEAERIYFGKFAPQKHLYSKYGIKGDVDGE